MLTEYIARGMEHARYELIDDEEPYYGEILELPGVWATGETLEACRRNLVSALEDWLLFSLAKGLPIPPIDDLEILPPRLKAA